MDLRSQRLSYKVAVVLSPNLNAEVQEHGKALNCQALTCLASRFRAPGFHVMSEHYLSAVLKHSAEVGASHIKSIWSCRLAISRTEATWGPRKALAKNLLRYSLPETMLKALNPMARGPRKGTVVHGIPAVVNPESHARTRRKHRQQTPYIDTILRTWGS